MTNIESLEEFYIRKFDWLFGNSNNEFVLQLIHHVNLLNLVLKETANKTTSEIITERIFREAKILLRQSNWNVTEIAFALGFLEVTHFNNFFKKNLNTTPLEFRKGIHE